MTDTYDDLVPLLDRLKLEQIPACDRPKVTANQLVFGLPASCLRCGGELSLINSAGEGDLAVGIVECVCGRQYELTVRMSRHGAY